MRSVSAHVQVSGELGQEFAQHADKFVSGVISNVEASYSKFESAIKHTLRMPTTSVNGKRGKRQGGSAQQQQRRRQPQRRSKAAAQQQKGKQQALAGGVAKRRARSAMFWG